MTSYINNTITTLYASNFINLALISATLYAMAILIYRFIGGGVITAFEGRGKRLAISIAAYYAITYVVGAAVGLTQYALMNVSIYFLLMFMIRSPEIGCYYVWRKSSVDGSIIIPREAKAFYNKFLIEHYGFFTAQKIRLVIYPAVCVAIVATLNLFFFAIPLHHELTASIAIIFSVMAVLVMLGGTYTSYITNTQYSGGYTNIDVESAEYSMGLYISLAAAFIIAAI